MFSFTQPTVEAAEAIADQTDNLSLALKKLRELPLDDFGILGQDTVELLDQRLDFAGETSFKFLRASVAHGGQGSVQTPERSEPDQHLEDNGQPQPEAEHPQRQPQHAFEIFHRLVHLLLIGSDEQPEGLTWPIRCILNCDDTFNDAQPGIAGAWNTMLMNFSIPQRISGQPEHLIPKRA